MSEMCKCGKQPSHPLYGSLCEDCWLTFQPNTIGQDSRGRRGHSGHGDDTDSKMISNQGPQSKRFVSRNDRR